MLEFEGVDEVPKIFTKDQVDHACASARYQMVNLHGQLQNLVTVCALPRRQEKALKRLVNEALHDYLECFRQDIELVTADEDDTEAPEIVTHVDAVCPYCAEHFNSMVILTEDEKQQGIEVKR